VKKTVDEPTSIAGAPACVEGLGWSKAPGLIHAHFSKEYPKIKLAGF